MPTRQEPGFIKCAEPRMLKIHGTPIGGSKADARQVLTDRWGLVSYERRDQLSLVLEVCKGFVLDNGAFSKWRQGHTEFQDYDGYTAWVEKLQQHPRFLWAIIPDHIAGTEAQNNAYLARWPEHLRGVPVYHMHHSLDRLLWLAQHYETVALGGGIGYEVLKSRAWWQRIREMMEVVTDEHGRPLCQLHGLRMLDPKVFTVLPLTSGDSTNVARNSGQAARFAGTTAKTRGDRACLIADRIEAYDSARSWRREGRQVSLFDCFPNVAQAA
ncbi:hypothetical protein SAMN06269173_110173 [Hymenobacter mucosus]|uniref:Uncharacterized protein n=2 Tax=Hymenobacter mucosus TaxID=1411120 RepID=A0A239A525_9BACT|nr:hypothetical protein SAMN06269173_110173 [Hymenobacter mucosus]